MGAISHFGPMNPHDQVHQPNSRLDPSNQYVTRAISSAEMNARNNFLIKIKHYLCTLLSEKNGRMFSILWCRCYDLCQWWMISLLTMKLTETETSLFNITLQNTYTGYRNHTSLYISFGTDMISINTSRAGRPLLRPCLVAVVEATLKRHHTLRNIRKCWHNSIVTVNKWSVTWMN